MDQEAIEDPWLLDMIHMALGFLVFGGGGFLSWWGIYAGGAALMILGAVVFTTWVALLPDEPED